MVTQHEIDMTRMEMERVKEKLRDLERTFETQRLKPLSQDEIRDAIKAHEESLAKIRRVLIHVAANECVKAGLIDEVEITF
jgi:hypothetical protein